MIAALPQSAWFGCAHRPSRGMATRRDLTTGTVWAVFVLTLVLTGEMGGLAGALPTGVTTCLANATCASCLRTAESVVVDNAQAGFKGVSQTNFFLALAAPNCSVSVLSVGQFNRTLHELLSMREGRDPNYPLSMPLDACMIAEYLCFANAQCRACFNATVLDGNRAIESVACDTTDPSLLLAVAATCVRFPSCSYVKRRCTSNSTVCAGCLTQLQAGDVTEAAGACPTGVPGGLLDDVVQSCARWNDGSCQFWQARCLANSACAPCLRAMSFGVSQAAIVYGSSQPVCNNVWDPDSFANVYLYNYLFRCPSTTVDDCASATGNCVMTFHPECTRCLNGTLDSGSEFCTGLLNATGSGVTPNCHTCSSQLNTINRIVLITSVVGGISVVACVLVILLIVAHGRDRISMQARVILGLMVSNAMYSIGNTFPVNQVKTDIVFCGNLALSFPEIRLGRSLWFGGKYALVCFEIYIVAASIWALRSGSGTVPLTAEAAAHTLCLAAGAAALAAFYIKSGTISRDGYNQNTQRTDQLGGYNHIYSTDDVNDDDPAYEASIKFASGRAEYDHLLQEMLRVWLGFLGLALLLWILLRVVLHRAYVSWQRLLAQIDVAEAADEWGATRRSEWTGRRAMMVLQKEGYAAVARPLEPFVIVFVIFAVPAIFMSTTWCQDHSAAAAGGTSLTYASGAITYGQCDLWCEFVLAWRSLATVIVYFYPRRNRRDLLRPITTLKLLGARLVSCCSSSPQQRDRKRTSSAVELDALAAGGVEAAEEFETGELIAADDIQLDKKIAEGSFGVVHRGRYGPRGRRVAIKVLKTHALEEDETALAEAEEDFRRECAILRQITHPNLLQFYGCGYTEKKEAFIVTELMALGSLDRVLRKKKGQLQWRTRLEIALGVAQGMKHLHGLASPIVHRDLKSPNVLLDEMHRPKVCDFGSSRTFRPIQPEVMLFSPFTGITTRVAAAGTLSSSLPKETTPSPGVFVPTTATVGVVGQMTSTVGTLMWMAPEMFRGDRYYGHKVDVYSFGVILWELATFEVPWEDVATKGYIQFLNALRDALMAGQRPPIPQAVAEDYPRYVALIEASWAGDYADRPEFSELVTSLSGLLHKSETAVRRDPSPPSPVDTLREPLLAYTNDAYM